MLDMATPAVRQPQQLAVTAAVVRAARQHARPDLPRTRPKLDRDATAADGVARHHAVEALGADAALEEQCNRRPASRTRRFRQEIGHLWRLWPIAALQARTIYETVHTD